MDCMACHGACLCARCSSMHTCELACTTRSHTAGFTHCWLHVLIFHSIRLILWHSSHLLPSAAAAAAAAAGCAAWCRMYVWKSCHAIPIGKLAWSSSLLLPGFQPTRVCVLERDALSVHVLLFSLLLVVLQGS